MEREKWKKAMNETDVIESLKQKEEELDKILNETRGKAAHIKKDALLKAQEIKLSMSKEVDAALENYKKEEMKKIDKEVLEIKTRAIKKGEDLKLLAEKRLEKTVDMAMHYIIEGNNK